MLLSAVCTPKRLCRGGRRLKLQTAEGIHALGVVRQHCFVPSRGPAQPPVKAFSRGTQQACRGKTYGGTATGAASPGTYPRCSTPMKTAGSGVHAPTFLRLRTRTLLCRAQVGQNRRRRYYADSLSLK